MMHKVLQVYTLLALILIPQLMAHRTIQTQMVDLPEGMVVQTQRQATLEMAVALCN